MSKGKLREGTEKISAIAYASKALTHVEQRYSQIEKEALALVWPVKSFMYTSMEKLSL